MELTTTKDRVLEAAKINDTVENVLKTIFPELFEPELETNEPGVLFFPKVSFGPKASLMLYHKLLQDCFTDGWQVKGSTNESKILSMCNINLNDWYGYWVISFPEIIKKD